LNLKLSWEFFLACKNTFFFFFFNQWIKKKALKKGFSISYHYAFLAAMSLQETV